MVPSGKMIGLPSRRRVVTTVTWKVSALCLSHVTPQSGWNLHASFSDSAAAIAVETTFQDNLIGLQSIDGTRH
jgi:hypothetical protein